MIMSFVGFVGTLMTNSDLEDIMKAAFEVSVECFLGNTYLRLSEP